MNMKNFLQGSVLLIVIVCLSGNLLFAQWTQIGNDIDGEGPGDLSGCSVSTNYDGSIIAIGATLNAGYNGDSLYTGQVRIYYNNSGTWQQIGDDIDGESQYHCSGIAVDIDSTGNTVAIGAHSNGSGYTEGGYVKVYENISGNWILKGNKINDPANFNGSVGQSVCLSSDGNTVAIGAPEDFTSGNNSGQVRVYEFISTDWIQKGNSIYGENIGDYAGNSVSLSYNGSILAIGSPYSDENGSYTGHVRIFEFNASNWVQMGNAIVGEDSSNYSGHSVSLSSNGLTIAIGAPYNIGADTTGHVRIFEFTGGSWQQKGNDIEGDTDYGEFGASVSLSSDGNTIVAGAPYYGWPIDVIGQVKVFTYNSGSWQQKGSDIEGEASYDEFGCSVSLSSDGNIIVVGAMNNDGIDTTDSGRGSVRVFDFVTGVFSSEQSDERLTIFPNPSNGKISILPIENYMVKVFDCQGNLILQTRNNEFDLSNEPAGLYLVEIIKDKQTIIKKILIE